MESRQAVVIAPSAPEHALPACWPITTSAAGTLPIFFENGEGRGRAGEAAIRVANALRPSLN